MEKVKVLFLFGGQSSEHSVSEMSAVNVLSNVDTNKFEPVMVGITKQGQWYLYQGEIQNIKNCGWEQSQHITPAYLVPDASVGGLLVKTENGFTPLAVDVVYPILHGKWGEDGTVQGLCSLANLPCVGPDMLSSALCMDKTVAKIMFQALNIPQANWVSVHTDDFYRMDEILDEIEQKLGYPVFVKPANAGSSVGIGKAKTREALIKALENAAAHDRRILVEEFIKGHEVESAPLGCSRRVTVADPGEVISCNEFYDFEAKYEADSTIRIPADLKPAIAKQVKEYAKRIFIGMGLSGMSRIDFFVTDDDKVLINEVNTLPGFTDISMYPKMIEHSGISQQDLITRLIEIAIEDYTGEPREDSFNGTIRFRSQLQEQQQQFTTDCTFDFDGETGVLSFFEPQDENGKSVRARILVRKESIQIVRTGDVQADFTFRTSLEKTALRYGTPYGIMEFEAKPSKVESFISGNGCVCAIEYRLYQNGEPMDECSVSFEVCR